MAAYCAHCGKECEVKIVDVGIGAYEYQGAPGVQSIPVPVSACCEETVYFDPELTVIYDDYEHLKNND